MSSTHPRITRDGDTVVMPAFATAHSHAFQRALRGRTQRRLAAPGSFWSWRGLMYDLVSKLQPEDVLDISRFAFMELALSGVAAVGEFHYVHHQPDGTPYDDRTLLAEAVIQAAREVGIRITLIRTAYLRAGHRQELSAAQRRFCDATVDQVLQDVESLRSRYREDSAVEIAVAAHSIRAVPITAARELADYARNNDMPFHMHVAEQRRELQECTAEYGSPPVALLADHGVLDENLVAIHATHLSEDEVQALGRAKATVCLCRTTERDLGDGLPRTSDLLRAGVKLCVGVDSHASSDAFEEIRAVELDERSRTEVRTVVAEAPELLAMAMENGYDAIGMGAVWQADQAYLNASHPALLGGDDSLLADNVVFAGSPGCVRKVSVNNRDLSYFIEGGRAKVLVKYHTAMKRLGLA